MKFRFSIVVISVLVLPLTGCGNADKRVEVFVDGAPHFPEFLVGKWKADRDYWEFTFLPDGTISSAVITWGAQKITPGQTEIHRARGGGKAVWQPGTWLVSYSHKTQELVVNVVMDYIRIDMGNSTLTGSTQDLLYGRLSPDHRLWHCEWLSYPKFDRLPVDPNSIIPQKLTFVKITREN